MSDEGKSNFEKHSWCLEQLKAAQDADHDNRENAREAHAFVDARQGQWEQHWWNANDGNPRYTFDMTNPIIDQIAGDMESKDFDIRIRPSGGDATKETAATYDDLVRNIENVSNSTDVYNRAGRNMITAGLDGWRVTQRYSEGDSFDQDLIIEKVGNYLDRVWLGPHEEADGSDARYGWVLTGIDEAEYEEEYPERKATSVEGDRTGNVYYYRNDLVMVGEFLYLVPESRELVLMSNGKVYAADELITVADELAQMGIKETQRRVRDVDVVYSRLFDNDGWLGDPRKTVFHNWIPLIPCYANFKLNEDKVIYWGAVEKILDPQRILNYSLSREIEEGALAPRAKYWMTPTQAEGFEDQLAELNTSADPVAFYNPDPEAPGAPQQNGGAQVNPGLRAISEGMRGIIGQTAGMFAANMGDNPNVQSGVAVEALQDRGDRGNNKYVSAREISQRHTARILVDAIPRVYGPGRQVRLLREDGAFDMATIGQQVVDQQTGQVVTLNDLSGGTYDVVCTAGPSYKNRQSETAKAITDIGHVDPTLVQMGGDILLNSIPTPGMDKLSERKRMQLIMQGMIPFEQMTDEEKQQAQQQQQQPPQPDANMLLAQAEQMKAQSDMTDSQTRQMQVQSDVQLKSQQVQVDMMNAQTNRMKAETDRLKAQFDAQLDADPLDKAQKQADIRLTNAKATGEEIDNQMGPFVRQ